jgi:hypothetical protein
MTSCFCFGPEPATKAGRYARPPEPANDGRATPVRSRREGGHGRPLLTRRAPSRRAFVGGRENRRRRTVQRAAVGVRGHLPRAGRAPGWSRPRVSDRLGNQRTGLARMANGTLRAVRGATASRGSRRAFRLLSPGSLAMVSHAGHASTSGSAGGRRPRDAAIPGGCLNGRSKPVCARGIWE